MIEQQTNNTATTTALEDIDWWQDDIFAYLSTTHESENNRQRSSNQSESKSKSKSKAKEDTNLQIYKA